MRLIDDAAGRRLVISASDVKAAAECEFAWLREIDARLGRVARVQDPEDIVLERAIALGIAHEAAVLEDYRARFGAGVVEIPVASSADDAALRGVVASTLAALEDPGSTVVYQAAFADGDFVGFADFLVRQPDGGWLVQDTKLARRARVTALMQLAAYVDQLQRLGQPVADHVELLLGDGTVSTHAVVDILPVYRLRRQRLRDLVGGRRLQDGAAGEPVPWGDDRYLACGRCPTCQLEVQRQRDLLLVAGMRPVARERLRAAGIDSIDALAGADEPAAGMNPETFAGLRLQAQLQLRSEAQRGPDDGGPPAYEVVSARTIAALPRPDHGDLFFDFEGDPLYTESGTVRWGIDYLFGWVDTREQYTALWAHSFAEERAALEGFLDFVAARRAAHPGMHIYHYAPYETTHLAAMAAHYGVREAQVDRLLRDGVFVDLYPIVRQALRVGSPSYSLKKLEPLYMPARATDVQRGDDSIVQYVRARELADTGAPERASAALAAHPEAAGILEDIAAYNRDDCVSTRRLRDWLVERARESGLRPSPDPDPDPAAYEPSARAEQLRARAERRADDTDADADADAQALRLAAAAIDYYPREAKTYWSAHFLRLREPVSLWDQNRDVVVVDPARTRVREDWHSVEGARVPRRVIEVRGELAPGTRLSEGGSPWVVYDLPAPFPVDASPRWIHAAHRSTRVLSVLDDGVMLEERAVGGVTWAEVPRALAPEPPPPAGGQQAAIDGWADGVLSAAEPPEDPATDLLRRRAPRTRSAGVPEDADDVDALVRWLLDLDHSYLAVQGPPGTGKTYVGSHVIERLVREHRWRIGVVAQSHAVVEHMLDRVVDAGLPARLVGKAMKDPAETDRAFTVLTRSGVATFAQNRAETGYVVGGTAWDFSNPTRIPRGSLDLLVVDEAGQFSLASTIAVAPAAERLLLLGDPQQLPQVSQGTHPEPVDTSALGWLMEGVPVLPKDRGRFLAQSRRMHPAIAAPVSHLSYAGRLEAHPSTAQRRLEGVEAGVHLRPIVHAGDATTSIAEADEVVRIVRDLLGRVWTDGAEHPRPIAPADLIVVTPYNAQQATVHESLSAVGLGEVRVGTVDKFQGQEAVACIVSLAASSAREAPRGIEFLLLQNRLNVAISRAQYAAYLVYSPGLLDDLPHTPEGVARLSAFARLVGAGG